MANDKELREKADMIAKDKIGFYVHFAIYIVVNLFLFVQWFVITDGEGFPWVITTTIGWGIGIVAHFIVVYISVSKTRKS